MPGIKNPGLLAPGSRPRRWTTFYSRTGVPTPAPQPFTDTLGIVLQPKTVRRAAMLVMEDAGFLISTPTPPPNLGWDDFDWSKGFEIRVALQDDERGHSFFTIPGLAYEEDLSRSAELRVASAEDEPWHTFFFFVPPAPNLGWDDYEGQRFADTRYANQTMEADLGASPILPAPGWDEVDWQKFWGLGYSGPTLESELGAAPIIPALVWDEDLSRSADTHFSSAEDDPWHTFFLIPAAPPNLGWDEWDWNKNFDTRMMLLDDERGHAFFTIPGLSYEEDQSKNVEVRAQQEQEPWQTFFTIPTPPPNFGWDDWDWSKWYDLRVVQQGDEREHAFFTIPNPVFDDEPSRDFSTVYLKMREPEAFDFTRPIVPAFGWFSETVERYAQAGFSGLLVLDEFINAPLAGPFGPFVGVERGFWTLSSLAASRAGTLSGLAAKEPLLFSSMLAARAISISKMAASGYATFQSLAASSFVVIAKEW